jgi:hypothetical protein
MNPIRKLGLAVLTVALGMAVAGIPSAMAESTALCATDETPCESKHQLTHIHVATLTGKKARLLTSLTTVECDVMFLGAVGTLGNPQLIEGNFTFMHCGGCTVTEENGPTVLEALREGHETAKVTGEGEIHVVCKAINCYYNTEGIIGTAKGPLLSTEINGEISIQEQAVKKVKGLLCPSTAKLDILLTTEIAPHFAKTESGATTLCDIDPGTGSSEVCPAKHLQGSVDQQTLLGAKASLLTSSGTVECEVNFLGLTVGESGTPLIVEGNFIYTGCGTCTLTEESGPYSLKFSKLGHETADVTAQGELHVICGSTINCYYNAEGLEGTAKGPLLSAEVNGEISFEEKELHKVKGTLCPTTAKLDLVLTTPSAPYISS